MIDPQFEAAAHQAGSYAAERIPPGTRLGIGTGRTASAFVEALGPRIAGGLRVWGLCTSKAIEQQAAAVGVQPIRSSSEPLDLDVDGADEFDHEMNLLKGGGGALLREKVVAASSQRLWVVADAHKRVSRLASTRPLPVEVLPFDWEGTARRVALALPCIPELRGRSRPYRTDNGNYILDLRIRGGLADPVAAARALESTPGVLGHGLFVGMATAVITSDGEKIEVLGSTELTLPDR